MSQSLTSHQSMNSNQAARKKKIEEKNRSTIFFPQPSSTSVQSLKNNVTNTHKEDNYSSKPNGNINGKIHNDFVPKYKEESAHSRKNKELLTNDQKAFTISTAKGDTCRGVIKKNFLTDNTRRTESLNPKQRKIVEDLDFKGSLSNLPTSPNNLLRSNTNVSEKASSSSISLAITPKQRKFQNLESNVFSYKVRKSNVKL